MHVPLHSNLHHIQSNSQPTQMSSSNLFTNPSNLVWTTPKTASSFKHKLSDYDSGYEAEIEASPEPKRRRLDDITLRYRKPISKQRYERTGRKQTSPSALASIPGTLSRPKAMSHGLGMIGLELDNAFPIYHGTKPTYLPPRWSNQFGSSSRPSAARQNVGLGISLNGSPITMARTSIGIAQNPVRPCPWLELPDKYEYLW